MVNLMLVDHVEIVIGGVKQGLGPISFIFMQFLAKILPNNSFLPQTHGLASPSGDSWIRRGYIWRLDILNSHPWWPSSSCLVLSGIGILGVLGDGEGKSSSVFICSHRCNNLLLRHNFKGEMKTYWKSQNNLGAKKKNPATIPWH